MKKKSTVLTFLLALSLISVLAVPININQIRSVAAEPSNPEPTITGIFQQNGTHRNGSVILQSLICDEKYSRMDQNGKKG